jgi:hypothetical protein
MAEASGFQRVLAPRLLGRLRRDRLLALLALGIVAAYALGFTPLVLLFGGVFFPTSRCRGASDGAIRRPAVPPLVRRGSRRSGF